MAVATVTFDGTRVNDAEATTNWTAAAATPTLEPDFRYQNANCISAAVKTSQTGFYYRNAATAFNMSSPRRVWMAKAIVTNKDALDGNGLILEVGTGARAAYYTYNVYSATTYPILGGWVVVPIDPNVSGFRSATVGGGATLTGVDMFGIQGDCNVIAKAPNLGMDAVDLVGLGDGLSLVGGDGADADGTFTSYVTADEGTTANRWGIVSTREGIAYVIGTLSIGSGSAAFGFADTNKVLVFPNGKFDTGHSGIKFKMTNVNSTGSINSCVFNGRGIVSGSGVDTRPDYTVTGALGKFGITGSLFNTFRNFVANSNVAFNACTFISGSKFFQSGSTISDCDFSAATTADGEAFLFTTDLSLLTNNVFTFSDGHAIQMVSAGTYTSDGNTFTGFGTTGTNDAAIYNNSGGLVTINVTPGSDTPSYRNGTSATTTVVNSVTLTVHVEDTSGVSIENAQVYIQKTSPTRYTAGVGNTAGNGTLVVTQTIATDTPLSGWVNVLDVSEGGGVSTSGAQSYRYASHDSANTFTFPTTIAFACTGGGTGTSLQDTVNSFVTNLREGDTIRNTTDGSWAVVLEINSASSVTTSPLRGGSDNTWTSGDTYSINDLATTLVSATDLADVPIMLAATDASGNATIAFPYVSSTAVTVRVRHTDGSTKYIPAKTSSTITSDGMSVSVILTQDTVFT